MQPYYGCNWRTDSGDHQERDRWVSFTSPYQKSAMWTTFIFPCRYWRTSVCALLQLLVISRGKKKILFEAMLALSKLSAVTDHSINDRVDKVQSSGHLDKQSSLLRSPWQFEIIWKTKKETNKIFPIFLLCNLIVNLKKPWMLVDYGPKWILNYVPFCVGWRRDCSMMLLSTELLSWIELSLSGMLWPTLSPEELMILTVSSPLTLLASSYSLSDRLFLILPLGDLLLSPVPSASLNKISILF